MEIKICLSIVNLVTLFIHREPVRCGATVRLTHVSTGKNLHSHHFKSPLSHNQEVSAFGDGGRGDEGDHWQIVCSAGDNSWRRSENIRLKHLVTER